MISIYVVLLAALLTFNDAVPETQSDLFSSTSELQKLYSKEMLIKEKLKEYLGQIQKQIDSLNYFLDTYYGFNETLFDEPKEYVSNPINTFVMIKRTGMVWPEMKKMLLNQKINETFKVRILYCTSLLL